MRVRREIVVAVATIAGACGDNARVRVAPHPDAAVRCDPLAQACGPGLKCTVTTPAPDGTVTACVAAGKHDLIAPPDRSAIRSARSAGTWFPIPGSGAGACVE